MSNKNFPIGVFDSGLGGLTVVKALMRNLPNEDIVYFGDTARVPYGTKSREAIVRFSKENTQLLLKHKVKMVVVACNSSSSYALPSLRKNFDVPVVGVIAPGVKKALQVTRNNRIGVIATSATTKSEAYVKQIKKISSEARVVSQACPLFVPLVEEGWINKGVTLNIAKEYLSQVRKAKVDTLILGCTHYPLLKPVLKKVMGSKVYLVDSAHEVSLEVGNYLNKMEIAEKGKRKPKYQFLSSDDPGHFCNMAKRFLNYNIKNVIKC
ncbi:MAG: glutamate racemase [Candidatus Omnitrophica bacterium]|nr:glutamate racemase [Candidatus Omnitrophota bacterium]